jgi:hypothetical protein
LVIALPSLAGGDHVTTSAPSANCTDGDAGRPGAMSGVITGDDPLHGPHPAALWARTLNDTGVPLVSPLHVYAVAVPTERLSPPSMRSS